MGSSLFIDCMVPETPSAATAELETREKLKRAAKLSYPPTRNMKGDTFVPCHFLTGTFSSYFPEWLRYDICPDQYASIIDDLNSVTAKSNVWSETRLSELSQLDVDVAEYFRGKDNLALWYQMDELALELNHKLLNPLGLHLKSNLRDVQPCEMGVIISRIPIHCDLTRASDLHLSEDLVVFPSYEYSNDEGSDTESLSLSESPKDTKFSGTVDALP